MKWQEVLDSEQERYLNELIEFVRIPSVSARPENRDDVQRAAEWLADRLRSAQIENVEVLPTDGHPVVYGDWLQAGADRPTVLVYGHFDVQPAEPFELWSSPPFEPELREGRLYGRGASDDKGSMLTPILAAEALLASQGALPINVKFFFEGQEEIGSPDLPPFVSANADRLAADMIFSADGLQWAPDQPQIVNALKGLVAFELVVRGPDADQHSGLHGGGIANPALALAQLLATMKSPDGRILVDGFYEDVVDLTQDEREAIARIPYDDDEYLGQTGAVAAVGEPGYSTNERLGARPTFDVNGLTSGWQGGGTKTVLPAEARAKVTCRLVADQSPERVFDFVAAHVARHAPAGVRAEAIQMGGRADPFLVPARHEASQIANEVLSEVYGCEPYQTRVGGSIPVMNTLLEELGVHAVMFGFSHADENLHAPDEFFRLSAFRRGQEAYVRLFQRLGES